VTKKKSAKRHSGKEVLIKPSAFASLREFLPANKSRCLMKSVFRPRRGSSRNNPIPRAASVDLKFKGANPFSGQK
jgi:hypothetical protein